MHGSPFLKYAIAAATTIASLTGCAGGSSTSPVTGTSTVSQSAQLPSMTRTQRRAAGQPATCTPSVWASELQGSPPQVVGFTAANTAPCIALIGPYEGQNFYAPFGLATDGGGKLYVADVNNQRVVVFYNSGVYNATLTVSATEQPVGVCVSPLVPNPTPHYIVATANKPIAGNGNVDFYYNYAVGGPSGTASGVLQIYDWCAFDKHGNFFADGTDASNVFHIAYLNAAGVNSALGGAPQTLNNYDLPGFKGEYLSMYVQKGKYCPHPNELSVATGTPTYEIMNLGINAATGKPSGLDNVTALTNYPLSRDPLYQAAPSAGEFSQSTIYIADYGKSLVNQAPVGNTCSRPGGNVTTYNSPVKTAVGIATYPTGQY